MPSPAITYGWGSQHFSKELRVIDEVHSDNPRDQRLMSHRNVTNGVPACVTINDGPSIEGEIFLQTATRLHEGCESPVEMLNRPERFFAVLLPSGDLTLVGKAQAAVVTCGASLWKVDPQRRAISREFRLDIDMIGGQNLCGSAFWELPSTHPRPQDFLNESEAFFELIQDGMSYSINRSLVAQVRPFE
jgi:hypothetical protein